MTSDEMRSIYANWHELRDASQLIIGAILTGPAFRYFWRIVAINLPWVTIEKVAPQTDGSYSWQGHVHEFAMQQPWRSEPPFQTCCCGTRQELIEMFGPAHDPVKTYVGEPQ